MFYECNYQNEKLFKQNFQLNDLGNNFDILMNDKSNYNSKVVIEHWAKRQILKMVTNTHKQLCEYKQSAPEKCHNNNIN